MLNRILSLLAEFFEAHPTPASLSTDSVFDHDTLFEELAELEAANLLQFSGSSRAPSFASSSSSPSSSRAGERDVDDGDQIAIYDDLSGDPDLDASLALALRLQEDEYLTHSSSSSSEVSFSILWHNCLLLLLVILCVCEDN